MDLINNISKPSTIIFAFSFFFLIPQGFAQERRQSQQGSGEPTEEKLVIEQEKDQSTFEKKSVDRVSDDNRSLDEKMDEMLDILTQGLPSYLEGVCQLKIDSLENAHEQVLNTINQTHSDDILRLRRLLKEKKEELHTEKIKASELEIRLTENQETILEDFEMISLHIFKSSTSIGLNGIKDFKDAAGRHAPELLGSIDAFIKVFKDVIQIITEFETFSDYDEFWKRVIEVKKSSTDFPGLNSDIAEVQQLLFSYCDKEAELITLLGRANTQIDLDFYTKILKREQHNYSEYPKLEKAIVDALEDRDYKYVASCEKNRNE